MPDAPAEFEPGDPQGRFDPKQVHLGAQLLQSHGERVGLHRRAGGDARARQLELLLRPGGAGLRHPGEFPVGQHGVVGRFGEQRGGEPSLHLGSRGALQLGGSPAEFGELPHAEDVVLPDDLERRRRAGLRERPDVEEREGVLGVIERRAH